MRLQWHFKKITLFTDLHVLIIIKFHRTMFQYVYCIFHFNVLLVQISKKISLYTYVATSICLERLDWKISMNQKSVYERKYNHFIEDIYIFYTFLYIFHINIHMLDHHHHISQWSKVTYKQLFFLRFSVFISEFQHDYQCASS